MRPLENWERVEETKKSQRGSVPANTLTKRHDSKAKRRPSIVAGPAEVLGAFKSGRSHMIHALDALDDRKSKLKRSESEKRREALKQSIKLVGRADRVSDGTMTYQF